MATVILSKVDHFGNKWELDLKEGGNNTTLVEMKLNGKDYTTFNVKKSVIETKTSYIMAGYKE